MTAAPVQHGHPRHARRRRPDDDRPAPRSTRRVATFVALVLLLLTLGASAAAAEAPTAPTALPAPAVGAAPVGSAAPTATDAGDAQPVELTLYWGDGCPRCEAEQELLAELADEYPGLTVTALEVWFDDENRETFAAAGEELGFEASSVPTTVIGERVWIGFTDAIGEDITAAVRLASAGEQPGAGVYGTPGAGTCSPEELTCSTEDESATVDVPLVGEVGLADRSLLVSTLVIGFVDGVNPCSLWVISVLLTIVVRTASRRRVLVIGSVFLAVTAGMYALYMAGIYSALSVVRHLGAIQVAVALAAGIFGAVSVKDYFAFKKGLSFTIKDSAKPGIYARVRAAAGQRALLPALLATVTLAVAVSLLETPCTAGFPVLWTGLLQANGVGPLEAAGLFVVYMVPFLLDELFVFGIAVVTMRAAKMQEKHGQLLKLVAGVTMLALAAAMAIDPTLMENPLGALVLFGAAFAVAGLVHVVTQRVRLSRASQVPPGDAPQAPPGPAPRTVPAGSDG